MPLLKDQNEICNQDIPKTILARSFKLGKLIEDGELIDWLKYKQSFCPLQIWTLKTCYKAISETITARSFKLGQLIENYEKTTC